jgi:nucleoside-diphosphate-sugar epimerase
MPVLVTGATGFVGRTLCDVLAQSGRSVRAALRTDHSIPPSVNDKVVIGDIGTTTDWEEALRGVDSVIHLAAKAHVLHDVAAHSNLYFDTNERGTQRLANASAQAGVRRFIYLSSIKVNGEETTNCAYTADDEPRPQDAYGLSKWFGEKHVLEAAARTGMEVSIVRSPLVYGPHVRANFLRLMQWIDRQWFLPFAAIENRRSLVSVWNLCNLLIHLLRSPVAPGRIWMVSDGEDLSTPELVRRLAAAMHRRVKLVPVPLRLLHALGGLMGRRAEIRRLCGSLEVDALRTREELDWSPPVTVNEGLARTVSWYLSEGKS